MDFPSLLPQNYRSLLPSDAKVEATASGAHSGAALVQREIAAPGLLERLVNRLEDAYWRQVIKSREAYLAKSQNLSDLENRIRELDVVRWRVMS